MNTNIEPCKNRKKQTKQSTTLSGQIFDSFDFVLIFKEFLTFLKAKIVAIS